MNPIFGRKCLFKELSDIRGQLILGENEFRGHQIHSVIKHHDPDFITQVIAFCRECGMGKCTLCSQ